MILIMHVSYLCYANHNGSQITNKATKLPADFAGFTVYLRFQVIRPVDSHRAEQQPIACACAVLGHVDYSTNNRNNIGKYAAACVVQRGM